MLGFEELKSTESVGVFGEEDKRNEESGEKEDEMNEDVERVASANPVSPGTKT